MHCKISEPPSILAIRKVYDENQRLPFLKKIQRDEILSDSLKLGTTKNFQGTDIPTKIIKENADIFANVLLSNFNISIEKSSFRNILKNESITPVFLKR